ncbi:MAG: hypothetical protein ACMUEL_07495 [Flavobacteriales bacterium Tduv]
MQTKLTKLPANLSYFHSLGIKSCIQKKAYKKYPLSRVAYYSK